MPIRRLKVVTEQEVKEAGAGGFDWLTPDSRIQGTGEGKGEYTLVCEKCGNELVKDVQKNAVRRMVLRCGVCRSFNVVTDGIYD